MTDVMQKNGVLVDGESVTPSDTGEEDLHALLMWYVFTFLLSLLWRTMLIEEVGDFLMRWGWTSTNKLALSKR